MIPQHAHCSRLTFASLDTFGPCMIKLGVAGISAFLEPRTATRATAGFAGSPGIAALWTRVALAFCRGCSCRRGSLYGHAGMDVTQHTCAHAHVLPSVERRQATSTGVATKPNIIYAASCKITITEAYFHRPGCPRATCD